MSPSLPLSRRTHSQPSSVPDARRRLGGALLAFAMIATTLPARAADTAAFGFGGAWKAQGPAPIVGDLVNVDPDGSVDGAIQAVVPHPALSNVLYVASVNGGIWVTSNATAATPSWRHLTDGQVSQSIGALELDPTDSSHRTLIAGFGAYSSFADFGDLAGLLRSTDGGNTWKRLTGGGVMLDKSTSGIAERGRYIVASVDVAFPRDLSTVGIFRSADFGATFTQISRFNGRTTGLPSGVSFDLAGDPVRPSRLFTSVTAGGLAGTGKGLFRSDDTGATWTKVSSPAIDAFLEGSTNVEFAVGRQNNVFVAIVNRQWQLAAVFRSGDGGATWTQMDLPVTIEDGTPIGIHPGQQGDVHLSLVADPTDANIVYIGGDRQPPRNEADPNATRAIFPNSIGSTGFWGRLFRGDASRPAGSQWAHITHSNKLGAPGGGTAHGSAPHVDSRDMAFDAAGNLIEGDDGGVYKRTRPRKNTGDWFALNGNLQVTEVHDVAFDRVSRVLMAGTQDNDVPVQNLPGSLDWSFLLYGDGGDVDIDDTSKPDESVRYSSVKFLRNFNRSTWDKDGNFLDFEFVPLAVLNGGDPLKAQFYTPYRLSGGNQKHLVVGALNGVYESLDRGDTATAVGPGIRTNSFGYEGVAYGVPANPSALYIGGSDDPHVFPGNKLWVRTAPAPAPLVRSLSYPGTGAIRNIVIDPRNGNHAFVVDSGAIYQTTDAGVTWSNVTGDLGHFNPSTLPAVLRSLAYVSTPTGDALAVGTNRGIYLATARSGFTTWSRLGRLLPTAPVMNLRYDAKNDQLIAGLLGRGVFTLSNVGAAALLEN